MAQQSKIGNSDNSQTAMQEFIEWVISLKDKEQQCIDWICIKSKSEDLLTKEKEHIAKAWDAGNHQYFCSKITNEDFNNGYEYYEENYKNK